MPIETYYKNIVKKAEEGLGDGTHYASASTAIPNIAGKCFTVNLTYINQLTEADQGLRGYLLYFPASGNKYHIVGNQVSSDTVYVFEIPQISDTGFCYVLMTGHANSLSSNYPSSNLSCGYKWLPWKSLVNAECYLTFCAHNFINDGGFEEGVFANHWSSSITGAGTVVVNPTSPLVGSYDLIIDLTSGTSIDVYQDLNTSLYKDKTYKVFIKAKFVGTYVSGKFRIKINPVYPVGAANFATWTNLSSGAVGSDGWQPTLTSSSVWYYADFTVAADTSLARLTIKQEATGFNPEIDEIYIYEKVDVDQLIACNHKLSGCGGIDVVGFNCNPLRTNAGTGTTVLASVTQVGKGIIDKALTSSSLPVYRLHLNQPPVATMYWEIGELYIGATWTWVTGVLLPFDPLASEWNAGYGAFVRIIGGKLPSVLYAPECTIWQDWFDTCGKNGKPFWWRFRATDEPLFVVNTNTTWERPFDPAYKSIQFEFTEKDPVVVDNNETGEEESMSTTAYYRGLYLSRKSDTELYVSAGEIDIHDGTYIARYNATSQITKSLTGLAGSATYFIYVNPPDSGAITATNIEYSTTVPTFTDTRMGYYHPSNYWRCIGYLITKISGAIASLHGDSIESEWVLRTRYIGHVRGLEVGYGSATTFTVSSGEIVIDNDVNTILYELPEDITITYATSTTLTPYYVYVAGPKDANGVATRRNIVAADINVSATAPTKNAGKKGWYHPTNTNWRFIGSFVTSGTNTIRPFSRISEGHRVLYTSVRIVDSTSLLVSPSWASVTVVGYAPLLGIFTECIFMMLVIDGGSASFGQIHVRPGGEANPDINVLSIRGYVSGSTSGMFQLACNATGSFDVNLSVGNASYSLWINGYWEPR